MIRDSSLDHLALAMKAKALLWLPECQKAGLIVKIIETFRDADRQAAAGAGGKSASGRFGSSPHNCLDANGNPAALAWDFAIYRNGEYIKDGGDKDYLQAGIIAEWLGLAWGGRWTLQKEGVQPDFDHIYWPDWRHFKG